MAGGGTAAPTARGDRVAEVGKVYRGFLGVGTGPTAHRGWPGLVPGVSLAPARLRTGGGRAWCRWPEKARPGPRNESCKESVQRAKQNLVGQGC